jgi:hypothetical protein
VSSVAKRSKVRKSALKPGMKKKNMVIKRATQQDGFSHGHGRVQMFLIYKVAVSGFEPGYMVGDRTS